jgi:hypothetical protein
VARLHRFDRLHSSRDSWKIRRAAVVLRGNNGRFPAVRRQHTQEGDHRVVLFSHPKDYTPVNWKHGEEVIIVPAVSDAEAKEKFPRGWRAEKPYLRYVSDPTR